MKLREWIFLNGSMPDPEWRSLGITICDRELARIEYDEAKENLAAAEAAIEIKKIQYGVAK